jgi:hypothetical protein
MPDAHRGANDRLDATLFGSPLHLPVAAPEKGTMLITLYARVLQSRSADPILRDPWGEEAVGRIDYDFEALHVSRWDSLSIAMRARQFDVLTCEFLGRHPDATVLHLGCGLDSRVYRVDSPPGVRWFEVDYPDVIELLRRLYPERAGYRTIGSSLADLGYTAPRSLPRTSTTRAASPWTGTCSMLPASLRARLSSSGTSRTARA